VDDDLLSSSVIFIPVMSAIRISILIGMHNFTSNISSNIAIDENSLHVFLPSVPIHICQVVMVCIPIDIRIFLCAN